VVEVQLADTGEGGSLKLSWPAEAGHVFGENIVEGYVLIQGWMTLSSSTVVGILSTVRNRILSFARFKTSLRVLVLASVAVRKLVVFGPPGQ